MVAVEVEPVATRARMRLPDAVRGAAVLLMVLDHVLLQIDAGHPLRVGHVWSITRYSLPLFMLASAAVWRGGRSWQRWSTLVLVAVYEWHMTGVLGMPEPGIVLVFLVVLVQVEVVSFAWGRRMGGAAVYALGVVGLVQALYSPVAIAGYQPGLVTLWWCLGYLGWHGGVWAYQWRGFAPLEVVGRHPLAWYCGHLYVIAFAASRGLL